MLRIRYKATDLKPGQLVDIDEDRGTVEIRVNQGAELPDLISALNVEINDFLKTGTWFQHWEGEILSNATPGRPLRVYFKLDPIVPFINEGDGVDIVEQRGVAVNLINPSITVAQFAAAMNPAIVKFLAKAQWFQFHRGEIVDMNSPETPGGEDDGAGIHRGQVVQERA